MVEEDDKQARVGRGYHFMPNVIFVMPVKNYFTLFPEDDILIENIENSEEYQVFVTLLKCSVINHYEKLKVSVFSFTNNILNKSARLEHE